MDFFGRYLEVTPPTRIVWTNEEGGEDGSVTTLTLTETDGKTLLVVSEVYASGWRAFVDGEEAPILPTHHVLRGVPLPAGQHTVTLSYDPLSLRVGLWISGIAAGAMLAAFVAAGWPRVARR